MPTAAIQSATVAKKVASMASRRSRRELLSFRAACVTVLRTRNPGRALATPRRKISASARGFALAVRITKVPRAAGFGAPAVSTEENGM